MKFDKEVNRLGTNSLKFDFKKEKNKPESVFPMWVADMDFPCSEEIIKDLHNKVDEKIFGYSKEDDTYFNAISDWYKKNFTVNLKKEWLVVTPGVVFALATAVKTLTKEGDYVLIQSPVYAPFTEVIVDNNRKVVSNDLVISNEHYEIDFQDFEEKIKTYSIKLFLLCSPHNPVGRVWKKDELDKLLKICKKYSVFVVSDEIHSDFVWKGKHTCLLLYKEYWNQIIICTSPSKTFNLAGMQVSNIFIPNQEIQQQFLKEVWNTGYSLINIMGLVACRSAYLKGQTWLDDLKAYLKESINFVDTFLKNHLPKIKLISPEGTYLLWLDFRELHLSDEKIEEILLYKANVWLDSGVMFGDLGKGFQRMNIALPRKKLQEVLENIEKSFKEF